MDGILRSPAFAAVGIHSSSVPLLLAIFSACATTPPENPALARGNQYARDGLFREATEEYKTALKSKIDVAAVHRNYGMVLIKLGDYRAAVLQLEKAMPVYEDNYDANFYLGEGYRALEQYSEAIFRYKKALKIKENDPKALKALAWTNFKIRFYAEAVVIGKKLYQLSPQDEQATIIYARTLTKLKRYKEALTVLNSARHPTNGGYPPYVASAVGDVHLERGNFTEACMLYRGALKDKPMLAGALLGVGRCLIQEQKPQQAAQYIERAARIRPQLSEAHYFLGKIYENSDPIRAAKYFKEFLKHAATDPELLSQVSEVKRGLASNFRPPTGVAAGNAQNTKNSVPQ